MTIKPIQWLLIGGPAHGRKVWIKYGGCVECEGAIYRGENHTQEGRMYRIGTVDDVSALQLTEVPGLIVSSGLKHFAGD